MSISSYSITYSSKMAFRSEYNSTTKSNAHDPPRSPLLRQLLQLLLSSVTWLVGHSPHSPRMARTASRSVAGPWRKRQLRPIRLSRGYSDSRQNPSEMRTSWSQRCPQHDQLQTGKSHRPFRRTVQAGCRTYRLIWQAGIGNA